MTDPLSPETIAYIVEWWESGNEPRDLYDVVERLMYPITHEVCVYAGTSRKLVQLNPAGITIARLARALDQMHDLGDKLLDSENPLDVYEEMSEVRRELLGE